MGRRLARELAFFVLFQYDLGRVPWPDAARGYWPNMNFSRCRQLSTGDCGGRDRETGGDYGLCGIAQDWPLARMARPT